MFVLPNNSIVAYVACEHRPASAGQSESVISPYTPTAALAPMKDHDSCQFCGRAQRRRSRDMTSLSEVNSSKLKFSVESILGNDNSVSPAPEPPRQQEPPCAGCVAALYRCCRDEPPLLQLPLPLPYSHLHPALRPTTGMLFTALMLVLQLTLSFRCRSLTQGLWE